jgi:hypothetical protein
MEECKIELQNRFKSRKQEILLVKFYENGILSSGVCFSSKG